MKAIICEQYGGPEVLQLEDVEVPRVGPNGVLVRVLATSRNPIDWRLRNGMLRSVMPVIFPVIWGADCSGVVEAVGSAVTLFKPGDEVYGFKDGRVAKTYRGTYSGYAVLPESSLARKPASLSHEEAADRKSTRLNSSHQIISYAVFCLKKKKNQQHTTMTTHAATT